MSSWLLAVRGSQPLRPFLKPWSLGAPYAVTLAYGVRTRELLIYRDLVQRCVERVPSLAAFYFVEHDADGRPDPQVDSMHGISGRVSVAGLWPNLRRPMEAAYYLSGPPAMLQTVSLDFTRPGSGRRGNPYRCLGLIHQRRFWRDRPVFVTGATGLLGAWLVRRFTGNGSRSRVPRQGLGAA